MSKHSEPPEAAQPNRSAAPLLIVWLWLFTYSLAGTSIPGVNEPHYLTKARSFADADWCSRDFFLQSANAHYCFYLLAGPLTTFIPFAVVAVVGRAVSLGLVAWGWCRLARALGLSNAAIVVSAILWMFITANAHFSGEWIVGGFESKVPAWGLGLAALAQWLTARTDSGSGPRTSPVRSILAGFLLGLSISLHPVVGIWMCLAIALTELADLRLTVTSARKLVADGLWMGIPCLIAALPGLIPALAIISDSSLTQQDQDLAAFIQVFWRLRHHLDPTEFPASAWLSVFALMTATFVLQHRLRRSLSNLVRLRVHRLFIALSMSVLFAATGIAIGWHTGPAREITGWEWRASLLKFYPFRLMDGLLPMIVSLFTAILMQHSRRTAARWILSRPGQILLLTIAFGSQTATAVRQSAAPPAGYQREQYAEWVEVCRWIRAQTSRDALFVTPRESFAFKWMAERAEYVVYKDCPQDAAGILEWNRRLWYLNEWTLRSSRDGLYDYADLQRLAEDTGADYVVTRTLGPFDFAPEYDGQYWKVYRIPSRP